MNPRFKDILDAPYFHVVFMMPEQLHILIYHNQKLLYDLIYKAVAETLMELSDDGKYLGAQIGQVKDYKNNNRKKTVMMKTVEFVRRFLMHILPKGFAKIRHYGLLANRNRKTKLVLCRKLTKSKTYKPMFEGRSTLEVVSILLK